MKDSLVKILLYALGCLEVLDTLYFISDLSGTALHNQLLCDPNSDLHREALLNQHLQSSKKTKQNKKKHTDLALC